MEPAAPCGLPPPHGRSRHHWPPVASSPGAFFHPVNAPGRTWSPPASQIDDDIPARPATADEHIALRRRIDRIGLVVDGPAHEAGLAGVADARTARPAD